jgi:thymidylate synthase
MDNNIHQEYLQYITGNDDAFGQLDNFFTEEQLDLSPQPKISRVSRIRRLTPEEQEAYKKKQQEEQDYQNVLYGQGNVSDRIFSNLQKYNHEEYQYLNLLQKILDEGEWIEGRNGRTKSIFGHSMRFSLENGKIPILTTKKTAWKTCLKELLWFIRGQTDNKILKEQGVHIWDANGSREFLNSRGLFDYEVDELGPIYGRQWRSFNKPYYSKQKQEFIKNAWEWSKGACGPLDTQLEQDYNNIMNNSENIDQLQQIINSLKHPTERYSRRLIMTAWNPAQLDEMALPPCHILCQFSVKNGDQLSCAMYQRSNDESCGTSFNIASYSFLTHLLAKHCGLKAHEFVYFKGDCHIYEDHIEGIKEQIIREPFEFPTLSISQVRDNINDYEVEDFKLHNYQHHPQIKFQMVA